MTIGDPPYVTIPLPSRKSWLYVSAMTAALTAIGGVFYFGAQTVSEVRNLSAAIAEMRDTPAQLRVVISHQSETDRRLDALEEATRQRDSRYAEVKAALQNLSDRLDMHTENLSDLKAEVGEVKGQVSNVLDAVTGRPYRNNSGKVIH